MSQSQHPEPRSRDARLDARHAPAERRRRALGGGATDRVHRVSAGLTAAGITHGDRVAFLDKNHPACVEVTLGASAIGAVHAIINWRLAGDELDYTINDSGARILFVGAELMPAIDLI